MAPRALIAGVSGIVGNNLASHLISKGWEVYGLARKPQTGIPEVHPIAADLLDPDSLRTALAGVDPTARLHHDLAPPAHRSRELRGQRGHGPEPAYHPRGIRQPQTRRPSSPA